MYAEGSLDRTLDKVVGKRLLEKEVFQVALSKDTFFEVGNVFDLCHPVW